MKMDGLYPAVLMNIGAVPLIIVRHLLRLTSPATYAQRWPNDEVQ